MMLGQILGPMTSTIGLRFILLLSLGTSELSRIFWVGAPVRRQSTKTLELRCTPQRKRAMQTCALRIAAGDEFDAVLDAGRIAITKAGFTLDYLELRDGDNLGAPAGAKKLRLLLAARIGATRLIDNIDVPLPRRA